MLRCMCCFDVVSRGARNMCCADHLRYHRRTSSVARPITNRHRGNRNAGFVDKVSSFVENLIENYTTDSHHRR